MEPKPTNNELPEELVLLKLCDSDIPVVGKVLGITTEGYRGNCLVLENPVEILIKQNQDGSISMVFRPVVPFTNQTKYALSAAMIKFETIPDAQLTDNYKRFITSMTSGIIVPDKKLLLS